MSENEWKRNEPEMVHFSGQRDELCDKIWSKWLSCVAVASRQAVYMACLLSQFFTWSKSVTMRKFVGLSPHGGGTAIYVNILADKLYYSGGGVLA